MQETTGIAAVRAMVGRGADIGGSIALIWLAYRLAVVSDVQTKSWAARSESGIDQLLVAIVGKTLRAFIVLVGSVMVVQSVTGIQMGPLIASLGLGGLAVALAAKDSVANFLGTLTVIFDKPFQIGDKVIIDKYEGTVESVGFIPVRYCLRNTRDVICHCGEWNDEAISVPRGCFGLDALAMTTVGNVTFLVANRYKMVPRVFPLRKRTGVTSHFPAALDFSWVFLDANVGMKVACTRH